MRSMKIRLIIAAILACFQASQKLQLTGHLCVGERGRTTLGNNRDVQTRPYPFIVGPEKFTDKALNTIPLNSPPYFSTDCQSKPGGAVIGFFKNDNKIGTVPLMSITPNIEIFTPLSKP